MPATINVAGLATIKVWSGGTLASPTVETLGYTQDGAEITFNGYFLDVPTDENGGTDGPPTDIQYLGDTAVIRLLMTKWDTAVSDKIKSRLRTKTAGTILSADVGTLLIAGGGYSYRLLVHSVTNPRNFPLCVFRDPIEINKGTKFSRLLVVATAYKDPATGVLWNSSTA